MKRIVYSGQFLKAVARLPRKIQVKLDALIALLAENPFHSLLHTKRLAGPPLESCYSFRITRDWRVVFILDGLETIRLLQVGHRKDIYRP